jgi:hypothetical protein
MPLVLFAQSRGLWVAINPAHVVALTEMRITDERPAETIVHTIDGGDFGVDAPIAAVADALFPVPR